MKAHVWYGPSGVIVAVGSPQGHGILIPNAGTADVQIIEVDVPGEDRLNRLHETHKVDVDSRQLVNR